MPSGRPTRPRRAPSACRCRSRPGCCALAASWPRPGHHIARSTTIGTPLVDRPPSRCRRHVGEPPGLLHPRLSVSRLPAPTVCPRDGLAVGQQVVHLHGGRVGARVGDQHEHVEERPGRALGEEPPRRRRRHAGALVAGRERLVRSSKYIARSTMIGTPLVVRIAAETSVAARTGRARRRRGW